MGWSFNIIDCGKDAFIESLTSARHFSEGYTPLAHRLVGRNLWQAVRRPDGTVFISLSLIAKERNGGWGYKGISEDMGPCEVNCPLSLLAMCSAPVDKYATNWREKVRAYHAKRKAKPTPVVGMVIKSAGHEYRLEQHLPARRGWRVTRTSDGAAFRMPAAQLSRALEQV